MCCFSDWCIWLSDCWSMWWFQRFIRSTDTSGIRVVAVFVVISLFVCFMGSGHRDHRGNIKWANFPDYRNFSGWEGSDHQAAVACQQQDRHSQRANFTRRYGSFWVTRWRQTEGARYIYSVQTFRLSIRRPFRHLGMHACLCFHCFSSDTTGETSQMCQRSQIRSGSLIRCHCKQVSVPTTRVAL